MSVDREIEEVRIQKDAEAFGDDVELVDAQLSESLQEVAILYSLRDVLLCNAYEAFQIATGQVGSDAAVRTCKSKMLVLF